MARPRGPKPTPQELEAARARVREALGQIVMANSVLERLKHTGVKDVRYSLERIVAHLDNELDRVLSGHRS